MITEFDKIAAEDQKAYVKIEGLMLTEREKGLEHFLRYTYNMVNGFLKNLNLESLEPYPEKESLRDKVEIIIESWGFVTALFLRYSYEKEGAFEGIKRGSKILKYLADEKFSRWGIEILKENGLEFVDLAPNGVIVREAEKSIIKLI